MDTAKAMYKGGKIIHANECDSSSYKNLGLLCPSCNQEVYLRKGNIRKPYFAHFHTTSSRQVEDCKERASVFGNSTETINIEDRGQRLEIFKKHFFGMISIDEEHIYVDLQFNNWMNLSKVNINDFTIDCTEYFLRHRQSIEDKYVISPTTVKDTKRVFQQQIALEAMNYLCVKSNYILFNYILNYSMYKLYNQQQFKLLMQEKSIKAIDEICHYAAKIIITNPWLEAFALVTDINDNSNIINKNDIEKTQDDKLTGISNLNQMNLTTIETVKLQNAQPLQLSFATVIKTGNKPKSQIMSVKLVTEINKPIEGRENDALTFSYLVSNYIKADSRTKNADGKYAKTTIEEWTPAKVYHFSKKFELSVDTYTESLFPTGGCLFDPDGNKLEGITTRAELAQLFESLIENNADSVQFLKYMEFNGKKQIVNAYDPTVLLLLQMLEVTKIDDKSVATLCDKDGIKFEKAKYLPIPKDILLDCFINASTELAARNYPSMVGSPIKSLSDMAKKQLAQVKHETELTLGQKMKRAKSYRKNPGKASRMAKAHKALRDGSSAILWDDQN